LFHAYRKRTTKDTNRLFSTLRYTKLDKSKKITNILSDADRNNIIDEEDEGFGIPLEDLVELEFALEL